MDKNSEHSDQKAISKAVAHQMESADTLFATEYLDPPPLFTASDPKHTKEEVEAEEKDQKESPSEISEQADQTNSPDPVGADMKTDAAVVKANASTKEDEKEEDIMDAESVDLVFADDTPEGPNDEGSDDGSGAGDPGDSGADDGNTKPVQKKSDSTAVAQQKPNLDFSTGNINSGENSTGIPQSILEKMEASLGADFSDVQVKINSAIAESAGAKAFAQGNEIHFKAGEFNMGTTDGQSLLGHELTHVVQQRQNRVKPTTTINGLSVNDDPALEREADTLGEMAARYTGGPQESYSAESQNLSTTLQLKTAELNATLQLAQETEEGDDSGVLETLRAIITQVQEIIEVLRSLIIPTESPLINGRSSTTEEDDNPLGLPEIVIPEFNPEGPNSAPERNREAPATSSPSPPKEIPDNLVDYYMLSNWDRSQYDTKTAEYNVSPAGVGTVLDQNLPPMSPEMRIAMNMGYGFIAGFTDAAFMVAITHVPVLGIPGAIIYPIRDIVNSYSDIPEVESSWADEVMFGLEVIRGIADMGNNLMGQIEAIGSLLEAMGLVGGAAAGGVAAGVASAPAGGAAAPAGAAAGGITVAGTLAALQGSVVVIQLALQSVMAATDLGIMIAGTYAHDAALNEGNAAASAKLGKVMGSHAIKLATGMLGMAVTAGSELMSLGILPSGMLRKSTTEGIEQISEFLGDIGIDKFAENSLNTYSSIFSLGQWWNDFQISLGGGDVTTGSNPYINPSNSEGSGDAASMLSGARGTTLEAFSESWTSVKGENPLWHVTLQNALLHPEDPSIGSWLNKLMLPSGWMELTLGLTGELTQGMMDLFFENGGEGIDRLADTLNESVEPAINWLLQFIAANTDIEESLEDLSIMAEEQRFRLDGLRSAVNTLESFLIPVKDITDFTDEIDTLTGDLLVGLDSYYLTASDLGLPDFIPTSVVNSILEPWNQLIDLAKEKVTAVANAIKSKNVSIAESVIGRVQEEIDYFQSIIAEGGAVETMIIQSQDLLSEVVVQFLDIAKAFAEGSVVLDLGGVISWLRNAAEAARQGSENVRISQFIEWVKLNVPQYIENWKENHEEEVERLFYPHMPPHEVNAVKQAQKLLIDRVNSGLSAAPDDAEMYENLRTRINLHVNAALALKESRGKDNIELFWAEVNQLSRISVPVPENNDEKIEEPVPVPEVTPEATHEPQPHFHTVVRGDNLWNLSRRYYGDPWQYRKIYNENNEKIADPHWIFPGQVLLIPGVDGGQASTTSGNQQAAPAQQKTDPSLRPAASSTLQLQSNGNSGTAQLQNNLDLTERGGHPSRNQHNQFPTGMLRPADGSSNPTFVYNEGSNSFIDEADRIWTLLEDSKNVYHQPPEVVNGFWDNLGQDISSWWNETERDPFPNKKFLSNDGTGGSFEAILQPDEDGGYSTNWLNEGTQQGTYNFYSPEGLGGNLGHAVFDILPHYLVDDYDSTPSQEKVDTSSDISEAFQLQEKPSLQFMIGDEEEELQMKVEPSLQLKAEEDVQMKPELNAQLKADSNIDLSPSITTQLKVEENIQLTEEAPAQFMIGDEEEELQMKVEPSLQLKAEEDVQMKPEQNAQLKTDSNIDLSPSITTQLKVEENIQLKPAQSSKENTRGGEKKDSSSIIPSGVNIHKESRKATEMGALAFAQGSDIHFAPGQYDPESKSGQELIGHELHHIVQQKQGRVKPTSQKNGQNINDDQGLEKEADDFGVKFANSLQGNGKEEENNINQAFSLSNGPLQKKIDPSVDAAIQLQEAPGGAAAGGSSEGSGPISVDGSQTAVKDLMSSTPLPLFTKIKTAPASINAAMNSESTELKGSFPNIEQPTGIENQPLPEDSGTEGGETTSPHESPLGYAGQGGSGDVTVTDHAPVNLGPNADLAPTQATAMPPSPVPTAGGSPPTSTSITLGEETVDYSAGDRPDVDTSGEADPSQMTTQETSDTTKVQGELTTSNQEIGKDHGENDIYPHYSELENLTPEIEIPQGQQVPVPEMEEVTERRAEVDAAFNLHAQPKLDEDMAQHVAANEAEVAKMDQGSQEEWTTYETSKTEEEARVKAEQEAAQTDAQSEVDTQRENWQTENDAVKEQFVTDAALAKTDYQGQIDSEITSADNDVQSTLTQAEIDAQVKADDAQTEADQKERESEEKKSGGFFGWLSDKVSKALDWLKDQFNAIINVLKAAVDLIIDIAKRAANTIIEAARRAITGLIRAFGELLKTFVDIAFAAFPEIRDRIKNAIDTTVETAVQVVNTLADGLKNFVNALLDALGAALKFLLDAYQKYINFLIDAIKFITVGLFKIFQFITNLVVGAWKAPPQFFGCLAEDALGGNPGEPLKDIEVPNGQEDQWAAAMGLNEASGEGVAGEDDALSSEVMDLLTKGELSDGDVSLEPSPAVELDAELLAQLAQLQDGEVKDLGGAGGDSVSTEEFQASAADAAGYDITSADPELTAESDLPAGENVPEGEGSGPDFKGMSDESKLQYYIDQMTPETEQVAAQQPSPATAGKEAGNTETSDAALIAKTGRLGVGQRLGFMGKQMLAGMKVFWNTYKAWIIGGLVTALIAAGAIAFFTGGAGLALAVDIILKAMIVIFGAIAIVKATGHVWQYVQHAWAGNTEAAGKSLAMACAVLVNEFLIDKILMGMGKVFRRTMKAVKASRVGRAAARVTNVVRKGSQGGSKAVRRGLSAIKNSRLVVKMRGVVGKGVNNFMELRRKILERFGFDRMWFEKVNKYVELWASFNPKILLMRMNGEVDFEDMSDAQKADLGNGRQIGARFDDPNLPDNIRIDGDHVIVSDAYQNKWNNMSPAEQQIALDNLRSADPNIRRGEGLQGSSPDVDIHATTKTDNLDPVAENVDFTPSQTSELDDLAADRTAKVENRDAHPQGSPEYRAGNKEVIDSSETIGETAMDAHAAQHGLGDPIYTGSGANTFDKVYVKDGQVYVGEAKGGGSGLGARQTPAGYAQQGTKEYLEATAQRMIDSKDPTKMAIGNQIQEALLDGDVVYFYSSQKLKPDGTIGGFTVSQFDI